MLHTIFLDIDGVLNCFSDKSKHIGRRYRLPELHPYAHLDEKPLSRFSSLMRYVTQEVKLPVEIVISSSWRLAFSVEEFYHVAKVVPDFSVIWDLVPKHRWKTEFMGSLRGYDIDKYLKTHDITSYSVIDDEKDFLPHQKDSLIITNRIVGFAVADSVKLLNNLTYRRA